MSNILVTLYHEDKLFITYNGFKCSNTSNNYM